MKPLRGLVIGWVLIACREPTPISDQELALEMVGGAVEVELGAAFPLTVVRTWSKDLLPTDFAERELSPLVVRLLETTRREDEHHVEETRRYQAYAFSLGEVEVPAPMPTNSSRLGSSDRG